MPIEIRELIIRTNIVSDEVRANAGMNAQNTAALKGQLRKEILHECKRLITDQLKKQTER